MRSVAAAAAAASANGPMLRHRVGADAMRGAAFTSSSTGTGGAGGATVTICRGCPDHCHQASSTRFRNSNAKKRLRTCRFYAIWRLDVGRQYRQALKYQVILSPVAAVKQWG